MLFLRKPVGFYLSGPVLAVCNKAALKKSWEEQQALPSFEDLSLL